MDVFFGYGLSLGKGSSPSVAMNANHDLVMVHKNASGNELTYRRGSVQHATVAWMPDMRYGDGREPSVALNATHLLEVHRGVSDDRLFYELARIGSGDVIFVGSDRYDTGQRPRVAINDQGAVFEVHKSEKEDRLWYRTGFIGDTTIDWKQKDDFADGSEPAIALNNRGQAIVAYKRNSNVYYRTVTTDGNDIEIHNEHKAADNASHPSIALTDDGRVILCYSVSAELVQRVGTINGTSVSWGDPVAYDTGKRVSVAAHGDLALQVHLSESQEDAEFFSTSIITDRSRWMADRKAQLGPLPLRELILPGSHDAGMYPDSVTPFGQAQNKSIYQQLTYGARWFDLRIAYWDLYFDYYAYHGQEPMPGGKLTEMLDDIRRFKEGKGSGELIVLKLSHFPDGFTLNNWNDVVKAIKDRIGQWLYTEPLPAGTRLADLTFDDYKGAVLVVVDGKWAKDHPQKGFWIYRNWNADDAAVGDLRVFDHYSDTTDYTKMQTEQIQQFLNYDGVCEDNTIPCDLFLLSWTLTPQSLDSIYELSKTPNRHLGDEVGKLPVENAHGKIINIVYTDFLQYARTSDVAIAEKTVGTVGEPVTATPAPEPALAGVE